MNMPHDSTATRSNSRAQGAEQQQHTRSCRGREFLAGMGSQAGQFRKKGRKAGNVQCVLRFFLGQASLEMDEINLSSFQPSCILLC